MKLEVRQLTRSDWGAVEEIYLQGIETGLATLETSTPTWESWNSSHLSVGRLLATCDEEIVGWAALSAISSRCVYEGVAEVSVYVKKDMKGKGVGKLLLKHLILSSEENGIWTLQAGIFPENIPSCRLHEALGFDLLGIHKKISKLNGVWMDVARYERRSKKAGIH